MTCPLPVLTTLYAHCMLTTLASALCSLEKSQVPFHPRFPRWPSGKEPACHCRRCRRHGFNPWFRKIPQRRAWQPTPVFLPGESHGQKSLVGHSPRRHSQKRLSTRACARARAHTHTHTHTHSPSRPLHSKASQKQLSACTHTDTDTHTHTHTPSQGLCTPLPCVCFLQGFSHAVSSTSRFQNIHIPEGPLARTLSIKWAHLFPSWSLLKHHLYLFIPSHLKLYIYYVPLPLECQLLEGWVIRVCFPVVYPVLATEQACLIHSFSGSP